MTDSKEIEEDLNKRLDQWAKEHISKLRLIDLLLLGLPDGKNEILNGRMFRQIEFKYPVEAAVAHEEITKEAAAFLKPGSYLLYLREKTLQLEIMVESQVVNYVMKQRSV